MSAGGRRRRLGLVLAGLLGVAVLAGLGTAAVYGWRVLPVTQGSLEVRGLRADLRIERDPQGVPTIHAGSMEDALFGLGFVHAQDRLWQMETQRRIVAGRLAEVLGPTLLDTDRFLRALGVRRTAAAQWQRLGRQAPVERGLLAAYTAGVNAYLQDHLRARPPEFLLLGVQPEPWQAVDSLGWITMMAWELGGNWANELLRLRLAQRLPVARIQELLPPYPGEAPLPVADYAQRLRDWRIGADLGRQAQLAAPPSGVEGLGSNNWAVAGARSRSGLPLLANDPHLRLSSPPLWYLARLIGPDFEVAGATMPGVPGVVLGQNRQIAWGFTNTAPDVQDLYLERLHPEDPNRYQTPEGWADFEQHDERIVVKGADPVTVRVRHSRHGPVISDADSGPAAALLAAGRAAPPRHVLALRWTGLDDDPGTFEASIRFMRAASVDEFIALAQRYQAPMQNMVVADNRSPSGHIGFIAAGRVPVRRSDNDLYGQVPAPGWEARYDWVGEVPADQTPRERDPPRGWIASANQRIHGPDYPHFLGSEWAMPYRFQRIAQLLQEQPQHDLDSLARIQADVLSLGAQTLLGVLKQVRSRHPLAATVAPWLSTFDGSMRADSPAATVYQVWARQLTEAVLADELGPLWASEFGTARSFRDGLERMMVRNDGWWCDDKRTPGAETCAQQATRAFDQTLDRLRDRLGPDPAQWTWGRLHQAHAEHRPFSRVAALARWFELNVAVGGDTHTVNASRVSLSAQAGEAGEFRSEHGPSLRALYDLGQPRASRVMLPGGQSGVPWSRHHSDWLQHWADGRYVPLWDDSPPALRETLVLRPAPS